MKKSDIFKLNKTYNFRTLDNRAEIEVLFMYLITKIKKDKYKDEHLLIKIIKSNKSIKCIPSDCYKILKDYSDTFFEDDSFLNDFIIMLPPYIKDLGDIIYLEYSRLIAIYNIN